MKIRNAQESHPAPDDLESWRQAVSDGSFRAFQMEAIIAAIQDFGPNADKEIINALVLYASDQIVRVLRRHVSIYHPNEGDDIIEEAHGKIIEALFEPGSADGKALRQAFVPRIRFRAADAIRADGKNRQREKTVENIDVVSDAKNVDSIGEQTEMTEKLYVEHVLSHIADERKRLAFRLHMEGVPLDSKRTNSIANVLGISGKTAGQWVEEVQAQLKHIIGEES